MENRTMLSKTIGLQKIALTNSLAIMSTMQQHGEDFLKSTLEQSPWLPGSSKDACLYWNDCCSKYLENLKSATDQGFAAIEQISSPTAKSKKDETQQATTKERVPTPRPTKKSPAVRKKTVNAKKPMATKTLPVKQQMPKKVSAGQQVSHEKLEVKNSGEVKTTTPTPKPSVTSQPKAAPALVKKESTETPLKKK